MSHRAWESEKLEFCEGGYRLNPTERRSAISALNGSQPLLYRQTGRAQPGGREVRNHGCGFLRQALSDVSGPKRNWSSLPARPAQGAPGTPAYSSQAEWRYRSLIEDVAKWPPCVFRPPLCWPLQYALAESRRESSMPGLSS